MITQKIIQEQKRRIELFRQVSDVEIAKDIKPSILRQLSIYRGAAGTWVNTEVTKGVVDKESGIAVSVFHSGKDYKDKVSSLGIEYDFPKTKRKGHDKNEIKALYTCYKYKFPIFVLTKSKNSKLRDVHLGYIEEFDEHSEKIHIKFYSQDTLKKLPIEMTKYTLDYNVTFSQAVQKSISDGKKERQNRLQKAKKKPEKVYRITVDYDRNPDVVASVLVRAEGQCELCEDIAPFVRKSDNTPYLEVHHIIQLSHGGNDTVENAIALCPNCHRKEHFGK